MTIARLRIWFALTAAVLITVVAGFYIHSRLQGRQQVRDVPNKLGLQIQQSTQGFTLSKSEAGRTLFTVRAANAIQFTQGGRAELHDVTIVVYGREANRFDQIYGKDFEYDPRSGDIVGKGEVHIDLEANAQGPARPDQMPPEIVTNPIRIETTGLVFNQKTGNAVTRDRVRFSMVQASGSAVGVSYNAKSNTLLMDSDVNITTTGPNSSDIIARHAVVTKEPRQAVLENAQVTRTGDTLTTDRATIFFRPDNTAERVLAVGNVRGQTQGTTPAVLLAPQGDFQMDAHNVLRSGVISGGVSVQTSGNQPMQGSAERAYLQFRQSGPRTELQRLRAVGNAKLLQHQAAAPGRQAQDVELDADGVDLRLAGGNQLRTGDTSGAAQIVITSAAATLMGPAATSRKPTQAAGPTRTTVTAGKFHAKFDGNNHINSLHGEPDAKIVSATPGQPDRISTSRVLDAAFAPQGGISTLIQTGSVHYTEPQREGWAQKATYTAADANLLLTGSPRIVDSGTTTTASSIRLNRQTGDAFARGEVKTTYSDLKPQPNGAMLASSDPIHATGREMTANRSTGLSTYFGNARLWQGGNIVEAPTITFNRDQRSMLAQGMPVQPVSTVFVQTDSKGRVQPVNVNAARLTYSDLQRQAHFDGNVVLKSADGTITADRATAYLQPRTQASSRPSGLVTPSQLDRIVAEGNVVIQQPFRRGTGERLVYVAAEDKFVLTGGPPSIFDAERGTIRGDSLTFYNRSDRVLVESKASSPAVTHTRVAK